MTFLFLALVCTVTAAAQTTPAATAGPEVEVSELLAEPAAWDQRAIVVTGELVGDYSRRDDGVWVQLNDDPYADRPVGAGGIPDGTNAGVGVLIPSREFPAVEGEPGRYGRSGPIVRLEGVFIHSDPARQGETYIAVEAATTLTPARTHANPGPDIWLGIGVALLLLAGAVLYSGRRQPRSHRSPAMARHKE